jgi:hypothetical protein
VAVDWSQFQPVAASPQGVDWGQFQPVEDAGPPEASFRGVRADSASTATPTTSPLGQFVSALKAVPGQIATGAQALVQGGDYPTDPSDQRRVLGVGEGMLRDAADIAAGWANAAYQWSPMGVAERTAQHIVNQFGGPTLPTMANVAEAGTEAAHSVAGIDENTMRFQSPRTEAAARFVPELLSNLVPVGGAAHEADTLLRAGERAVTAEAVAGVHGPEAQGTAVADQLTQRGRRPFHHAGDARSCRGARCSRSRCRAGRTRPSRWRSRATGWRASSGASPASGTAARWTRPRRGGAGTGFGRRIHARVTTRSAI